MSFSLEAIAYQVGTVAFTEITELFQKVIDYKKEHPKLKDVIIYANETIPKGMIALLKKHFGITVEKFTMSRGLDFSFYCIPRIRTWNTAANIIEVSSGLKPIYPVKGKPVTAAELEKIVESVDTVAVKFNYGAKNKVPVSTVINFDPYGGFFGEELIGRGMTNFTAAELAAIMLHETGHMFSTMEHCADIFWRMTTLNEAINYFQENAPIAEKIAYATKALSGLKLGQDQLKKAQTALGKVNEAYIASTETQRGVAGFSTIVGVFVGWIGALILSNILNRLIDQISELLMNPKGVKRGDLLVTRWNSYICERYADEFVARLGGGAALASGLDKLHKLMNSTGHENSDTIVGKVMHHITLVVSTLIIGCIGEVENYTYEHDQQRLESILQATIGFFKLADIPDEQRKLFIRDYESIVATLNSANRVQKNAMLAEKVWQFITYVASPVSLVTMVTSGRFTAEYRKLVEDIQKLKFAKLYYRAAKLQTLK